MSERPILFSAPMVRAILAGTKTQTRRVLKQAVGPSLSVGIDDDAPGVAELSWLYGDGPGHEVHESVKRVPCPYGTPGDRLWVREAWAPHPDFPGTARAVFRADPECAHDVDRWRPSIHMPRAVSRITLEITGVRVERLQDISRGDAMAEGCPFPNMAQGDDPREWYRDLWDQINGAGAWDANPWVWCVSFKRP